MSVFAVSDRTLFHRAPAKLRGSGIPALSVQPATQPRPQYNQYITSARLVSTLGSIPRISTMLYFCCHCFFYRIYGVSSLNNFIIVGILYLLLYVVYFRSFICFFPLVSLSLSWLFLLMLSDSSYLSLAPDDDNDDDILLYNAYLWSIYVLYKLSNYT